MIEGLHDPTSSRIEETQSATWTPLEEHLWAVRETHHPSDPKDKFLKGIQAVIDQALREGLTEVNIAAGLNNRLGTLRLDDRTSDHGYHG